VLAYCDFGAPLLSLQSFYNYARGHCEAARSFFKPMHSVHLISVEQCNCACPQSANCSGVCWEEGMGGGGVLVLQEVGTMKSLHWRCEMQFDCIERKRRAKLPLSTTAPRAFAAAPSFPACLRAFICTFCMCVCIYVCVCMCADMYICIYVHVCMYLYIYAFIHMCMCMCIHICA